MSEVVETRFAEMSETQVRDGKRLLAGRPGRIVRALFIKGRRILVCGGGHDVCYYWARDLSGNYINQMSDADQRSCRTLVQRDLLTPYFRTLVPTDELLEIYFAAGETPVAPAAFGVVSKFKGQTHINSPGLLIPPDRLGRVCKWIREIYNQPDAAPLRTVHTALGRHYRPTHGNDSTPHRMIVLSSDSRVSLVTTTRRQIETIISSQPNGFASWLAGLDNLVGASVEEFTADPLLYFKLADVVDAIG